jgi:hypothetical protein
MQSIHNILSILLFFLIVNLFYRNFFEHIDTFNGDMATDNQYSYDNMFDNVTYYPNIYEQNFERSEEIGFLLSTGWEKCKKECKGNCIEYGVTGHSYCFN